MNTFKIAFSNIKKRKSNAITFFSMIILTTIVLSLSLTLFTGIGSFYKTKRKELNGPDFTLMMSEHVYLAEMNDYIESYPGFEDYTQQKSYLANVSYESTRTSFIFLSDIDSNLKIIDKLSAKPAESIILPLSIKYAGYKSGQQFEFNSAGKDYVYTIYGFFEDSVFGGNFTSLKLVYLSDTAFRSLDSEQNFAIFEYFSVYFDNDDAGAKIEKEFVSHFYLDSDSVITVTPLMSEQSATMFVLIMSAILMLVALIVLSIALIIVRFNIVNNINEDTKILGSLKSIGFTSRQLRSSIIIQFGLISIIGSVVGLLFSALTFPYLANLVASTSGMTWTNSSSLMPFLISLVIVNLIVILISYIAASKIKKVTPVKALRSEAGDVVAKNHFPLSQTKLPLDLNIGFKNMMNNKRNNLISFTVVILFSFLSILSYTLYHNFVVDNTAFKNMIGFETADIVVGVYNEESVDLIFQEIQDHSEVVKTIKNSNYSVKINNDDYNVIVWEDISKRNISTVIEGKDPYKDNEVAIPIIVKNALKKKIGDELIISFRNISYNYTISGFTQSIGDNSQSLTMSEPAFRRLNLEAKLKSLYIYLDDNVDIQQYCNYLENVYGREITVFNIDFMMETTFNSIKSPIETITYLIALLTLFTVIFILFLLINTLIRRYKKTIGIYKALGYSNFQVVKQIQFTFTPVIILGSIFGLIIGLMCVNPILGIFFSSAGIKKAGFEIPVMPSIIIVICLLIVCISVIFAMSYKVRKITPHKLLID